MNTRRTGQKLTTAHIAILLWFIPLAFLLYFFFYPLSAIFGLAIQPGAVDPSTINFTTRVWRPLLFTFYQAGLSTLLTLLVGLPAAYLFARFKFPGKGLLRVLTTLPFIMPTVVAAAGFNALLGGRGLLNALLMNVFDLATPPVNILNTLWAILLAHVFYNTTIIIRVVSAAWSQLDPRLEQAARALGASPWRVFREITLPLLRPSIISAVLLVFLFDFTSFGVILLLGGPRYATLEVEIYTQALYMLNLPLAALLSAIQLFVTLIILVLHNRLSQGNIGIQLAPRLRGEGQRVPRNFKQHVFVWVTVLIILLLLVSPLIALSVRSVTKNEANRGERGEIQTGFTLDYYRELFLNRRGSLFYVPPIAAMRNSIQIASTTVLLSLTLGFLSVYALTRRTWINRILDPLFMLPLGASAVTLGLGFIIVFNRPPVDVRSFPLLLPIAHTLVALPFVIRTLKPAIESIPERLREAAAILGADPWRVWLEVDLPIIARAALVSAVFSFTISLGEFGATTFLARPERPTMPLAIFRFISQPGAVNYGQALAMATLLMLVCTVAILLMERLQPADVAE